MSARVIGWTVAALVLAPWCWPAMAEPLTTIDLSSPALRCVFATNKRCNLNSTASLAQFRSQASPAAPSCIR